LFDQYNQIAIQSEALAREAWLAAHLKSRGYRVFGGH